MESRLDAPPKESPRLAVESPKGMLDIGYLRALCGVEVGVNQKTHLVHALLRRQAVTEEELTTNIG
jgi:hypothetical protein